MNERVGCRKRIAQFNGTYSYLSNFYQAVVTIDGIDYPSAEHAFQAQKTEDVTVRRRIALASTSAEAKRLGRTMPLINGWDECMRYEAMERVIEAKFYPDRSLANQLCDTVDAAHAVGVGVAIICLDGCSCVVGHT